MPLNDLFKLKEFFFMVFIEKILFYFRGMTFKWLLENAPGWVAFLIARDETSGETQGVGNRWLNKMALRRYVYLFEESKELVRMKREEKQRRTPGAFEY